MLRISLTPVGIWWRSKIRKRIVMSSFWRKNKLCLIISNAKCYPCTMSIIIWNKIFCYLRFDKFYINVLIGVINKNYNFQQEYNFWWMISEDIAVEKRIDIKYFLQNCLLIFFCSLKYSSLYDKFTALTWMMGWLELKDQRWCHGQ